MADASGLGAAFLQAQGAVVAAQYAALAAIAGSLAGIFNSLTGIVANNFLEARKATLNDKSALRRAKIEYEYEARKRLYDQCEPAIFRFLRECELAKARVHTLATQASAGELEQWIKVEDQRISTIYRLFAPISIYYSISNTLTAYDLTLAPRIHALYGLGRLLRDAFSTDRQLAGPQSGRPLPYNPNAADDTHDTTEFVPAKHQHQGLTFEQLDILVAEMSPNGELMPLPTFVRNYRDAAHPLRQAINSVEHVVRYLDRDSLPVLWRVYTYYYGLVIKITEVGANDNVHISGDVDASFSDDDRDIFNINEDIQLAFVSQLLRQNLDRLSKELKIA